MYVLHIISIIFIHFLKQHLHEIMSQADTAQQTKQKKEKIVNPASKIRNCNLFTIVVELFPLWVHTRNQLSHWFFKVLTFPFKSLCQFLWQPYAWHPSTNSEGKLNILSNFLSFDVRLSMWVRKNTLTVPGGVLTECSEKWTGHLTMVHWLTAWMVSRTQW